MRDKLQIHFLTWPSGELFEGSQNSTGPDLAIARALQTWLIPQWFPGLDFGARFHGLIYHVWPAMEKAGFKVQSIDVPEDMAKGLSR